MCRWIISISICFLVSFNLVSCSTGISPKASFTSLPPPTSTKSPTNTSTPSRPSTNTPSPSPTDTDTPKLPEGTPITDLYGIPVMPSAIAGEKVSEKSYKYVTKESQEAVVNFYITELTKMGWVYSEAPPPGPGKYIHILPNDRGGYIIYYGGLGDIIYVYEEGGLTHVKIYYSGEWFSMRICRFAS